MDLSLKQLIQNRNELIEAHKKNDFTDGIHALLTDLYPDTAHFIYELLQNAEDMNATIVRFVLKQDGIDFEHNGTKRPFNIKDIDAITNIGHNRQKRDDPTSIGKFGVGFKAVFAYTSTPIIHSGEYHFKIRDYFVPEFNNIPYEETIDKNGVAWTKFSFPFNNPQKPAKTAYEECLEGLETLDESAILFLQNIKKIEYTVSNHGNGYVELVDAGDNRFSVKLKKTHINAIEKSEWLRFDKLVDIVDDKGNNKNLSVAIAYALAFDENTKKEKIVPTEGRTFIYFPAEKEHSGLRFHINAPFASTVARDSVRSCEDNKKLIKSVSQLVAETLPIIKNKGLMNHSFFETLPNEKDGLSNFYRRILDFIYVEFQRNEYLPAKNGGFISAPNAIMGQAIYSSLLNKEDLESLFGIFKYWIVNAPQKNSNADNFIHSMGIESFEHTNFIKLVNYELRSNTERYLAEKPITWLKTFYSVCADANYSLGSMSRMAFINDIKQTKIIVSTKKKFYKPTDIYILPINASLVTPTTPIVNQEIVLLNNKSERITNKIFNFFCHEIGIQEYGQHIEIKKLLKKYESEITVDERYFKDILSFAKYRSENSDIDFESKKIFLYENKGKSNLYVSTASDLFLGKAYGNELGETLADAYRCKCLWEGYLEHYNENELQLFLRFIKICGVKKVLTIENCNVRDNPLFLRELAISGKRETTGCRSSDYTIPELHRLLKMKSFEISKAIWVTLLKYEKNNAFGRYRYEKARYSPNATSETRTCDSTLIYYLKNCEWVPDKEGVLRKPEDVSAKNLHNEFAFDPNNKLLEALKLGSANEKQNIKKRKLEEDAKEVGMHLVSESDYQKFIKWQEQEKRQRSVAPQPSKDLFAKQNKNMIQNINAGDDFSSGGAVSNISKREINIEATFCNSRQMKLPQKKLFGRISESTKEEKNLLKNWYYGKCQMCDTKITGYNLVPHFVAKNIINTQHLSTDIRQTTNLAWNSLCLCPNCAAKYDVCSRDLNGLYEQIINQEVIEGDDDPIILTITLDNKIQQIHYVPKHFLALKKVLQLIDKEFS